MKKLLTAVAATALAAVSTVSLASCGKDENTIYVNTNVPFAPFEYLSGTEITGVDVDIMNMVGEKLGKKVNFTSTDFDYIIDNVASGAKFDCGAAGLTVTEERKELVDFSITYFTSVQYVVYKGNTFDDSDIKTDGEVSYVLWDSIAGLKLGVQRATTGDLYVADEIESDGGVLHGTGSTLTKYDDVMVATTALNAGLVNAVVIDKLPAEYVVKNSTDTTLKCVALYYAGENGGSDEPTREEYAIAVTKGNTELLNAINEVLTELLKNDGEGINALVAKHLGLNND